MKYFLDGLKVSLEELKEEQIAWKREQFGSYENDIVLGAVINETMYFSREQFYLE